MLARRLHTLGGRWYEILGVPRSLLVGSVKRVVGCRSGQLENEVPSAPVVCGAVGCGDGGGGGGGGAKPKPGRPRGRTCAGTGSSTPAPTGPSPRPGSQPSRRSSWWPTLDSPTGAALLPTNPGTMGPVGGVRRRRFTSARQVRETRSLETDPGQFSDFDRNSTDL